MGVGAEPNDRRNVEVPGRHTPRWYGGIQGAGHGGGGTDEAIKRIGDLPDRRTRHAADGHLVADQAADPISHVKM